ncbi:hypothetical protein FRC11_009010, partial [Ceratobasidium sp. 423]
MGQPNVNGIGAFPFTTILNFDPLFYLQAFMLLKDSLARLKTKWKKGLRTGSSDPTQPGTPSPSIRDAQSDPVSTHLGSGGIVEAEVNSNVIPPPQTTLESNFESQPCPPSGRNKTPWSGIKSLLGTLESSGDAFGPLKSVASGLNKCIDIYETLSKGRKEYEELRESLERLLNDLAGYMNDPNGLLMTNSVKRLCYDIEAEIKSVEEKQAQNTGRRLIDAVDASDEIFQCYRRIHAHLERLTLNLNMSMLEAINELKMETRLASMLPAKAAIYNSAESVDIRRRGCTPGTREPQIELLLEWSRHPEAGRTCWINGMAGTGKTTIAYTVCGELEKTYELAASFFCSRVIPECRQVKHIIPTIAYQLARTSLPFRCALVKILESNPDARSRVPDIQYQKLMVEPLLEVQGSLPTDFIIVIDALDECENESSLSQILDLFLSTASTLPIRFLVSSRPEMMIYQRMMDRVDDQGAARLVLHDLDADLVQSDIKAYMMQELEYIPLTDAQWEGLIERCGVLFIYASTTCRYIKQGYDMESLDEAVDAILDSASASMGHGDEHAIDALYSTILTAAFGKSRMSHVNRTRMKNVLETVICAQEPMTTETISDILGLESAKQVDALLKPLRSVVNVGDANGLVTTLHASFPDFMFSSDRSATFYCTPVIRHHLLAEACLRLIDGVEPKFNICGLPSSYLLDYEVEDLDERVQLSISSGLVYACLYWSTHLYLGEYVDELVGGVRNFFLKRLLIWMEIINLTDNMWFGTNVIRQAEKWCQ